MSQWPPAVRHPFLNHKDAGQVLDSFPLRRQAQVQLQAATNTHQVPLHKHGNGERDIRAPYIMRNQSHGPWYMVLRNLWDIKPWAMAVQVVDLFMVHFFYLD
ncbi:unnamed protein product [Urochloa humidicola]